MSYSFPAIVLASTAATRGAPTALTFAIPAATSAAAANGFPATAMSTLRAPAATATPSAPLGSILNPAMSGEMMQAAQAAQSNPAAAALAMSPGGPFVYVPSFSIAVVGAVIFLLLASLSIYQCIRFKTWYFNLLPQAALLSAAGMIARTDATLHIANLSAFAAQMILLAIPGSLIAIANIFTFTRVMWWVTPSDKRNFRVLLCPPKWISAIWVAMLASTDIVKTVGMNLRANSTAQRASEIGLIMEFFVLTGFAGFVGRFMWMSKKWMVSGEAEARDWRRLGWTVCFVATLGALRAIYVVLEFDAAPNQVLPTTTSQGLSFIATHEWTFWFGDVLPIFLMYSLFSANHPGEYLPREYTRLRFKIRNIERLKSGGPWQLTISNPIPNEQDVRRLEEGKMFVAQGTRVEAIEVPPMPVRKDVNV